MLLVQVEQGVLMAFPKIMSHPDKSRIVRWLGEGKGVRRVSKMLREMYPDDRSRWLSVPTLQDFRKKHMKLEGDVLDDIKKAGRQKDNNKIHTAVRNLPSYKQKLAEIVDLHVDIKKGLVGMEKLVTARLEDLFDAAQRGEATIDKEKLLQGYFDRYFVMIDKWAKYVDKVADFRVEANINVTVIQEQMAILRQTVHELLREMDPELAIGFLDRLNARMRELTYRPATPPTTRSLMTMRDEIAAIQDAEIVGCLEEPNAD
jgi:chorismate mutase